MKKTKLIGIGLFICSISAVIANNNQNPSAGRSLPVSVSKVNNENFSKLETILKKQLKKYDAVQKIKSTDKGIIIKTSIIDSDILNGENNARKIIYEISTKLHKINKHKLKKTTFIQIKGKDGESLKEIWFKH